MNDTQILRSLMESMQKTSQPKTSAYDTTAEVRRIEDGVAWVHIAGGVDETPVRMTINAKEGDTVQVRVSGGTAFLVGNGTAPPTDDTRANVAQTTAVNAQNTADTAIEDAERAKTAADSAQASADSAAASAASAQVSANNANEYASRALGGLSTVQSVAETLNWITQHGTMEHTSDQTLDPTHVYFVPDSDGDYVVGNVHYSVVTEPSADDLSTYYVLSIDESLQNYVGTHLAVTGEGLWVLPAASGYKVLIATGQGVQYTTAGTYIIDASGNTVAKFGQTTQIGQDEQNKAIIDPYSFKLKDKGQNTYFHVTDLRRGNDELTIAQTFFGNGESVQMCMLTLPATDTDYTVTVSDESGTLFSKSQIACVFDPAPNEGAIITIVYNTTDNRAKALTFGSREPNLNDGALSSAFGYQVVATGFTSFAEGDRTISSNLSSHAEGRETTASGSYSHAEGQRTTASNQASHAEGYGTTASGGMAHAEGNGSVASGAYSHAQNAGTKASSDYQTALGKFNIEDNNDTYAFIIGNGTSDSARSNALTVDWNGNVNASGNITGANTFNIVADHITQTGISVAANSYTDVALTRTVTGTFLGATVRVSGTANAVDTINNVTASTLTVRLKNVSASALSGIQVDAWVLVKTS